MSPDKQDPHTWNTEQSLGAIPITENITNIQPIVFSNNEEFRCITRGAAHDEEDDASNLDVFFDATAFVEEDNLAPNQITPTKHQDGYQLNGPPRPEKDSPTARPRNGGMQSGGSDSFEISSESLSPYGSSSQKENKSPSASEKEEQSLSGSQKENESPSDGKIHRLARAIEKGRQIRYLFNRASNKFDIYASRSPGDERESDNEASSQKENESPSHKKFNRFSQVIEMGRHACHQPNDDQSGECDMTARRTPDDTGKGSEKVIEQGLSIDTTNSGPHALSCSRNSPQKENKCPNQRSGRVLETTDRVHQTQFRSREEMRGQDTFVHASGDQEKGLDDDVRHGFLEAPTLLGQDMHSRSPSHGISNAITPDPSHVEISRSEHSPVRPISQDSCEDPITLAQPKHEVDQEWSSDEDEICRQSGSPKDAAEENRGDLLAVMVRGKTVLRKISPIPLDLRKVSPVRTPSASRDGTESEDQSSACSYLFGKGAVKDRNQEFVLTAIEGPEIRQTNLSDEHPPDIEIWLDDTESSESNTPHEKPAASKIWHDPEYDSLFSSGEQEEPTPELGTLRDLNNRSASSLRERHDKAESFELGRKIKRGNLCPLEGEEELSRVSAHWEDDEPEDAAPDSNHEKNTGSFDIWEENELSDPAPDVSHTESAPFFEIWEDSELGIRTLDDKQKEAAGSFEIWEDNELDQRSPISQQKEIAASFAIWIDAEDGCAAGSQSIQILPNGALNNVSNIPRGRHLQMVDSARAAAVAWDMTNGIDGKRVASLRKARELPHPGAFRLENHAKLSELGQADDRTDAIQPTHVLSALREYSIDHPPCPPNSLSSSVVSSHRSSSGNGNRNRIQQHRYPLADLAFQSPGSSPLAQVGINRATPLEEQPRQKQGSAPAESFALESGRIEGSISAPPFSPTQRLAHPTPRRWINPEALFERFHRAAGTTCFDRDSGFRNFQVNTGAPSRQQPGKSGEQSRYVLRGFR